MAQTTYNLSDLNNVQECTIHQTLEGEYTGNIKGIYESLKSINSRDYINVDGQKFIVIKPKKSGGDCKTYWEAELWHISYSLLEHIQSNIDMENVSYSSILSTILSDTSFTVTSCDSGTCSFKYAPSGGLGNKREALMQFLENNELEIKFDNYNVEVKSLIGVNSNYTFEYKKDIKSISVTEDTSKQVTRIYPINDDGVGIADVNGGLDYLDADNISNYDNPICSVLNVNAKVTVEESTTTDGTTTTPDLTAMKNFIKSEGQKYLDKFKYGYITFDVDVLNYVATYEGGHSPLLNFNIGDSVTVSYTPFGANIGLRISTLDYDALRKRNLTITLENIKYKGKVGEYEEYIKSLAKEEDKKVEEKITEEVKNTINTTVINQIAESVINTDILNTQILNAQEINTEILNTEELYADYGELGIANIKDLTVDELKTRGTDGFLSDTNNYIHAQKQYIQWITGTKSGTEQAKDYKGNNLYYVSGNSGGFTLATKKPNMLNGSSASDAHILSFVHTRENDSRACKWITVNDANYLVYANDLANVTNTDKTINTKAVQFTGNMDILFPSGTVKIFSQSPAKIADAVHTVSDVTFTALNPVMQNTFAELIKAQFAFISVGGTMVPCIQLGAGNGTGDKGKAFVYKGTDGLHIDYNAITNSKIFSIVIDDTGIHLKQDDGAGTITDISLGKDISNANITDTTIVLDYTDSTSDTLTINKSTDGYISTIAGTDFNLTVTHS